ncbi:phage tail tip lysozyme [Paracoccus sanguinis]|uniref:Phage tail lysozyme domain-containing protein n=1 Tax=Paracoccus sanguinis TaxID=1545044 RepID=A0A1H2SRQ4_9RHOB|nr:phage tail tip lysozyme [Paracoccus sanguinis]KGJ19305.1 hypothetical protein IX57_00125 [Paracoccus sanguinis]SDW34343.1 hypothetical protein SAMN05444276_101710 [Paracoccus sanguinis]
MTQSLNIAMVLRADAGQAKGTLQDFQTSLQKTTAEAAKVRSALDAEAAAMQKVIDGALRATAAKKGLAVVDSGAASAALTRAFQQTASTARISIGETATAVQAARASLDGYAKSFAGAGAAIAQTAQASVAWRAAMDDIRASFNPLFGVSRQYEQQLERIADAERMGAISAREAAAARQHAAAQLAPAAPLGSAAAGQMQRGTGAWVTGNLAAQGNDIMMMAMAGQSPLMLALQQGTQVSQVLNGLEKGTSITRTLAAGFMSMINPVSLVTMGLIALGAVGVQALAALIPKSKSFDDAMGDLSGAVSDYGKQSKIARASTEELAAEFGSAAGAAQGLARAMADIDRRRAMRGAGDAVNALQKEQGLWLVDPTWRNDDPNASTNAQLYDARRARDRKKLRGVFGLDGSSGSTALIDPVLDAMTGLDRAKTIEAQVAAVERLKAAWEAAAEARGGSSKEEDEFLAKIVAAGQELARLKGLQENAAGKVAAAAMARDLERQSVLQLTILQYGQDSAQVRAEELHQQQELTAEKLRGWGIDQNSATWQKIMAGMRDDAAARERSIVDDRARAYDNQMAALALEARLIGATTAERLQAKAVAEAQRDADEKSLSPLERALEVWRAITRATAEAANERAKAIHDLQTTILTDALDAQIGMARDPLTKADLEGERERVRVMRETKDATLADATANAARARSLTEAISAARGQIATISDEVAVRQQVAAQVAAGTLAAGEANAAIQRELQLRPLIAAAARAEGDEKRRLTEIVTGLRVAHQLQAAEERRQAQNDYLRGAAERVQQARLELALVGQTAAVRARVLALVQAERDIRAQGLTGAAAEEVRTSALELVDLNRQIDAQADAWERVQGAGEAAIDAVLDKLKGGDVKGAVAGLLDELNKGFFDLAVRNPLKNMLLGTNLGTLDDVGGLAGIWGRLTGRTPLDQDAVIGAATQPVQAMQIAAAQVTINAASLGLGDGAAGLLAGLPGATGLPGVANVNAAPLTTGRGVAGEIWNFFAAKGLAPHQIAAIVGHAGAESGFNPAIAGDNGNAIGLWQHNGPRMRGLLDAIGGRGNLGNVTAQAEYVWREFMGAENGAYRRLMAAPDLRAATWAMQGFERPSGYNQNVMGSGMHWEKRLAGAEQALATFGSAAQAAATPVGQMGQSAQNATGQMGDLASGMGQFGGALQQILGAALSGNKGGALGGLVNLGLGLLTQGMNAAAPGFARGGPTGGTDPSRVAGVVHEQEYVFSAASVRRIGARNLDALHRGSLRGFASGGFVGPGPMTGSAAGGPAAGGNVTFAPSFDLRGANDPAEVERAARRGMAAALEDYDRFRMPGRVTELLADRRVR